MRSSKLAVFLITALGGAVLAFQMGQWLTEDRRRQEQSLSESRFAQIRLALMNYHQEHGRFPPTKYQPKANGPIHSWRLLLLPYQDMYARKLCSKYNFSEDWNSPRNLAVVQSLQSETHLFSLDEEDVANYLTIGDGEDWPSEEALRARVVTRGKDRFLLFEYPDSSIRWAEPRY